MSAESGEKPAVVVSRVIVTDFDMPFGSMVGFIVKWTLASIPALIMLGILAAFLVLLLGGLGSALNRTYGS